MHRRNHLSTSERLDLLRRAEMFEWLDDTDRAAVAAVMDERNYDDGEVIFQQGDPGGYLVIIIEGGINITLSSEDGREVMLNRAGPGDMIGEIALLDNQHRSASGIARAKTRVLRLDRDKFEILRMSTQLSDAMVRFLCGRLRKTMDFAESVALYNLEARLARLLIYFVSRDGRENEEGVLIDRKLPQAHLGMMINAARPNVNIQMQAWRKEGIVETRSGRILITDLDAIRARAQMDY